MLRRCVLQAGITLAILSLGPYAAAQVFGQPSLTATTTAFEGADASEIGHGDFNNDGRQDIVVARLILPLKDQASPVQILLNQGNGTFAEAPADFFEGGAPGVVHPRETIIEDFNGDGRDDIFIADHGYDAPPFPGYPNTLLLSRPDGRMQNARAGLTGFSDFTHSAAAGDIDGDGDLDIYLGNPGNTPPGGEQAFLINDGSGGMTRVKTPITAPSEQPLSVDFGDVNGDKIIDLVMGAFNGMEPAAPPPTNGYNIIRRGNGDGTFAAAVYDAFPARPLGFRSNMHDMKPLDFDSDGDLDYLGTGVDHTLFAGRYIQAMRNNGSGVFADATGVIPPAFNTPGSTQWILYVHAADVDGDCRPDVVVQDWGPAVYLPGQADGTFGAPLPIPTIGFGAFEILDMDGDGGTDIVRKAGGQEYYRTPSTAPRNCNGLASAVAPSSRTVSVGATATAFFAVSNGLNVQAHNCRLVQKVNGVETRFWWRETNPATNAPVGSPLRRFDIPAGGTRTFVFGISPQAAANNVAIEVKVDCINMATPVVSPSVNRFSLTGAAGAAADIIPVAVTLSGDGVVRINGFTAAQVFGAAATNVRDGEALIVRARYTGTEPIVTFVCETNASGACLAPPVSDLATAMNAGQVKTFTVLVDPRGQGLPADFANRRIVLEFLGQGGAVRGQASVAVATTYPPD